MSEMTDTNRNAVDRLKYQFAFDQSGGDISVSSDDVAELLNIISDLTARAETAEAARDALRNAQRYTYIGKDGKSVPARDLEDQRDALHAEVDMLRNEIGRLVRIIADLNLERRIAALETPNANATVRKMARIARGEQ